MKSPINRFCYLLLCAVFFYSLPAYGDPVHENDSITATLVKQPNAIGSLRNFESLDDYVVESQYHQEDILDPRVYEDTIITETIANLRARAQSVFDAVKTAQKYVSYLDEQSVLELPVGINKSIGNLDYTILIDSVTLRPDGAYLTVYMMLALPSGQDIAFRGSGIKFSKNGGIQAEDGKLQLIGDYPISIGEQSLLVLNGDGGTSVSFDCDGFKNLSIDADILFSRDFIVPDMPDGTQGEGRVATHFQTTLNDWNDFLVEVSIPDFQVKSAEGFGFTVNNAVFDYSDYRNSPTVNFPTDYLSEVGLTENIETWRGFYMRNLNVRLPSHFTKNEGTDRITFSANDMIIDNNGFTGLLKAENLINIDEGNIEGWGYSLSEVSVSFQASQLLYGSLEGELLIPITDDQKAFEYTALITSNNEYEFSVVMNDTLNFPLFNTSKVELFANSSVTLSLIDDKFLPKANLYGTMDITTGEKGVSLASIDFENLQVQTVGPYLSADYFSFGSEAAEQALSNFPVQITNVGFRSLENDEVALDFDLAVNVTESFSGEAGVAIIGSRAAELRTKYKYERFEVDRIALDIKTNAFDMNGQLIFYKDDAIYGDGFNGQMEATIHSLNLSVEASAIFGTVDGYRYWYFDAGVQLAKGITVTPGFDITGFGGGAYQRMGFDKANSSPLGATKSGAYYLPKESNGLGLKASISFAGTGSESSYNGEAAFEIAFFPTGGVRYISFKGMVKFMTPPASGTLARIKEKAQQLGDAVATLEAAAGNNPLGGLIAENNAEDQTLNQIYGEIDDAGDEGGQILAKAFVEMDFENNTLYGLFEAYIEVAGGMITGVGANGRAGWIEFYFAPDEWYVYVGTPTDPIGLSAGIGPIRASLTSYFVMGTTIPGSPPPPDNVSEILGDIDLDYMGELNELGSGAGVGFGAAFNVDTGDLTFLTFYASFEAGAGFDVMLKDYGDTQCVGGGTLGINGWYANGQAYAYFDGEVGIRVKVFGKKKNIEILSIGAAAVLQAKLPNPFWMRGIVGGRFSVLGGLVKGNCQFEVTLGEECEIQQEGSVLEGVNIIADISPADGSSDVSVFATPQAVFNIPVDQEFEMVDYDQVLKKFRTKLDFFQIKESGSVITGDIELNFDKNVCVFNAFDVLPPQKTLDVEVQVSFQEYRSGRWQSVIVDGEKYTEYMSGTFKSGDAPDYIPLSNVAYSYPSINQLNFYKEEYGSGYITLKQGQPYLFEASEEWEQKGRYVGVKSGTESYFDYSYASGEKKVTFSHPSGLAANEIYAFELVNLPAQEAGSIDRNIQLDSSQVAGAGDTKIVSRQAEGSIDELQEKNIFETHFRTSYYNTFEAKINAQAITRTSREILFLWEGLYISNQITSNEAFSVEELVGNANTENQPMVRLEADLTNTEYFNNAINPLIYSGYPVGGVSITNRDTDELGVVPVKAISIGQNDTNLTLSASDISIGSYNFTDQSTRIRYLLSPYMYFDFIDLQAQLANKYLNESNVSERIDKLLWGQFPIHSAGSYHMKAHYYLPGQATPNSTVDILSNYGG